jgi:hypothetical protein
LKPPSLLPGFSVSDLRVKIEPSAEKQAKIPHKEIIAKKAGSLEQKPNSVLILAIRQLQLRRENSEIILSFDFVKAANE